MKAIILLKQYRYSVRPMKKRGSLALYNEIQEAISELEALLAAKECIKESDEWEAHIHAIDEKFEAEQLNLERYDV
jgi:hypothetical protein